MSPEIRTDEEAWLDLRTYDQSWIRSRTSPTEKNLPENEKRSTDFSKNYFFIFLQKTLDSAAVFW